MASTPKALVPGKRRSWRVKAGKVGRQVDQDESVKGSSKGRGLKSVWMF